MADIEQLIKDSKDAQRYEEITHRLNSIKSNTAGYALGVVCGSGLTGLFAGIYNACDSDFVRILLAIPAVIVGGFTISNAVSLGKARVERDILDDEQAIIEARYSMMVSDDVSLDGKL